MRKMVKIAEVKAQSVKSREVIAETLENSGFTIVKNEDPCLYSYF